MKNFKEEIYNELNEIKKNHELEKIFKFLDNLKINNTNDLENK